MESVCEALLDLKLMPRASLNFLGSPDSAIILGRQGMLRMKNPHVISAHAQKRRGPMKYMLSVVLAKVTV